jgi:hypothetical protein
MGGVQPLRYVDTDDAELAEYPLLAESVREGGHIPLVQVGDELKTPSGISIYWAEEELRALGVDSFMAAASSLQGRD